MFGVSPDSAASYLFTARMLLRQDFGPVAEEYAQKAVSLDAKLPLAHFLLGEIALSHSKISEAAEEFEKELQLNPGYAPAYYKLADAYSRIQKFDEAEKLLQRSIWLDSTSTGPYILMGKVLAKKGETELAVRTLPRALAMDPNNPVPHHLLGQAYRDLGRSEDAERELKLAAQLEERQSAKPRPASSRAERHSAASRSSFCRPYSPRRFLPLLRAPTTSPGVRSITSLPPRIS